VSPDTSHNSWLRFLARARSHESKRPTMAATTILRRRWPPHHQLLVPTESKWGLSTKFSLSTYCFNRVSRDSVSMSKPVILIWWWSWCTACMQVRTSPSQPTNAMNQCWRLICHPNVREHQLAFLLDPIPPTRPHNISGRRISDWYVSFDHSFLKQNSTN